MARRRKFEGAWIDRSETEAVETILPAVVRARRRRRLPVVLVLDVLLVLVEAMVDGKERVRCAPLRVARGTTTPARQTHLCLTGMNGKATSVPPA